jgi:hypothetical protein
VRSIVIGSTGRPAVKAGLGQSALQPTIVVAEVLNHARGSVEGDDRRHEVRRSFGIDKTRGSLADLDLISALPCWSGRKTK